MEHILLDKPIYPVLILVTGLLIILFGGLTPLKFENYRRTYIALFVIWAVLVIPLGMVFFSGHHDDCWPDGCGKFERLFLRSQMILGFLVILFNWVIVYELVRRKKTFWTKPFKKILTERVHSKLLQVFILLLNVPFLTMVLWFIGELVIEAYKK